MPKFSRIISGADETENSEYAVHDSPVKDWVVTSCKQFGIGRSLDQI